MVRATGLPAHFPRQIMRERVVGCYIAVQYVDIDIILPYEITGMCSRTVWHMLVFLKYILLSSDELIDLAGKLFVSCQ